MSVHQLKDKRWIVQYKDKKSGKWLPQSAYMKTFLEGDICGGLDG